MTPYHSVSVVAFVLTAAACLSTYVLYPAVAWLIGHFFRLRVRKDSIEPTVSILIPAYNEERNIAQKIENTLRLDYPRDKTEILVGTDGASDRTAEIVRGFTEKGVRLMEFVDNRGKTAVQNDLVKASTGEILIFTDAASFLSGDAVRKIVRNFADERIGCVAGMMRFVDTDHNITTESQGLYWKYESGLREIESRLGRLIGVDGPLYAVRRSYYAFLDGHIISDLMTPLLVLEQGGKVVLETEAVVDENPTTKTAHEFNTRRRITLRGLVGISEFRRMLNPLVYPLLAAQIFFHKLLRWFIGPLVVFNFLSCLFLLNYWMFQAMAVLYGLFAVMAFLGWGAARLGVRVNKVFTVPYYFGLVNFAATMGIIDFFRKKQAVRWKPVRS